MKTIILIFNLFLIFPVNSFACECPEYDLKELDNESFDWSDLVVIGEVIKIGKNYQVEINEILKGKFEERIINGTIVSGNGEFEGCSSFPSEKGKYLLYLKKIQIKGKIFYLYSECLGTRRLDLETVVIPLRTDKTKSELIVATEKWIEELRRK